MGLTTPSHKNILLCIQTLASEKEAAHEGQYSRRVIAPHNVAVVHFIRLLLSYSLPSTAAPIFYSFFFFVFSSFVLLYST